MELIAILTVAFIIIIALSIFKRKLKYFLLFCIIESLLVLFILFYENGDYRLEIQIYGNILVYLIALIFLICLLITRKKNLDNL